LALQCPESFSFSECFKKPKLVERSDTNRRNRTHGKRGSETQSVWVSALEDPAKKWKLATAEADRQP